MREVSVDIELLGNVLQGMGLVFRRGMEGRAYDMRPVSPREAGTWLMSCLESYENRTGQKPTRFSLSGTDLLILA